MSISTCSVLAAGSQSGSGNQSTTTVATIPADGFYLLCGAFDGTTTGDASFVCSNGLTKSILANDQDLGGPLQYVYLSAGATIGIQVNYTGSWSLNYSIYAM